jgi:hypothetical protein
MTLVTDFTVIRKEVIFVTTLLERQTAEVTRMPRRSRLVEWVMGIAGVLAAGVGAWMYYVPTDWFLGGLAEGWYLGLFVGAGLLLAAAFGLFARDVLREEGVWTTQSFLATTIAILALAGAVVFGLVWIL